MAQLLVTKRPCKIIAPDALDNEIVFSLPAPTDVTNTPVTAIVKVISGTWQFSVGTTADYANAPTYTSADGSFPITFVPDTQNIHCKAANAAEGCKINI